VAGRTSGLIGKGESVTWVATHFGVRQQLTSCIVSMERPRHFRDSMLDGAFKRLDHDHFFETLSGGHTLMKDIFVYTAPLGLLGVFADVLFLKRYMARLLVERNATLKRFAEAPASSAP
jgi:ligand-binding SRPBCC domain-containing protein